MPNPSLSIFFHLFDVVLCLLPGKVETLHHRLNAGFDVGDHAKTKHVADSAQNQMPGAAVINEIRLQGPLAQNCRR